MLVTHPDGQVSHLAPPAHHADLVPSAREINAAWLTLMNTLTETQFTALKPALRTIQRALPVTSH